MAINDVFQNLLCMSNIILVADAKDQIDTTIFFRSHVANNITPYFGVGNYQPLVIKCNNSSGNQTHKFDFAGYTRYFHHVSHIKWSVHQYHKT